MTINEGADELCEMNVTPFIDVMLVLLIIFMVVTPIVTSSVKVELPKASSEAKMDQNKPIILSINDKGELFLKDEQIQIDQIANSLDNISSANKENVVYFYVDKAVSYERLMQVVQAVKQAQYAKIAFSTKMMEQ